MPPLSIPLAMRRSLALIAVILAGTQGPSAQVTTSRRPDPQELVERFRARAIELPFVQPGELAFGRHATRSMFPNTDPAREAAIEATLRLMPWPDRLVALLAADEPKVRLLAAYALFRTADAAHLPALGALADDDGTVPCMPMYSFAIGADGEPYPKVTLDDLITTTVGAEVAQWLAAWEAPPPAGEAFEGWCVRQQEFAPTAVCLRLKMRLATGGSLSTGSWTVQDLLEVLWAAGAAPRGAREIAQIALFGDRYQILSSDYPDIEAHLGFAARRLGRENLLRMLRDEAPILDGEPLAPESFVGFTDDFARFVLERPMQVGLRAEDADALLEIGRTTVLPACFRAAARLRPAEAQAILREGLMRSAHPLLTPDHTACAIQLWEMEPERNVDFLAEWFHTDPEGALRVMPTRRQGFAVHLLTSNRPADRRMFARLVTDERFVLTDPVTLQTIVQIFSMLPQEPGVPEFDLLNFGHPLGLSRAFGDLRAATGHYPVQTQQMLERMAAWRGAIRAQVADW